MFYEKGKKWVKMYTSIDFESCNLRFFEDVNSGSAKFEVNIKNCEFFDAVKSKNRPCTIKIVPFDSKGSKSHIYVSGEKLRDIDELKVELEEVGGSFEGLDRKEKSGGGFVCGGSFGSLFGASHGERLRIEFVPVEEWTKKDVLDWLRCIGVGKKIERSFGENDIDGSIIEELDETTMTNIGIDEQEQRKLLTEIQRVKKNRTFSRSRWAVKSKFERFPGFSSESREFQEMIDSLCDSAQLKHRFLNTSDLAKHTKMFSSSSSDGKKRGQAIMKTYEDVDGDLEKFLDNRIKIKIVVTEILQSNRSKNIRTLISPIVNGVIPSLQTDFGFFHTALIIGPWYLEWTDSELVIPKRMVSGRAIISADVDSLVVPKEGLQEISDKISDIVVKWNTKYTYRSTPAKGKNNEGNCQDFVDDILQTLGVSIDFKGALGQFVDRMRKSGKCILEFAPSKQFKEQFQLQNEKIVFHTHKELDTFCIHIRQKCLDVFSQFQSEWSLLKSFDRAFWLRHLKMPDDPRYKPLPPEEETLEAFATSCPFDDPRKTKSYV